MKKITKIFIKGFIKEILFWTWCLPQTLIGLVVKFIYKAKKVDYRFWVSKKINGSISLGKYIILDDDHSYEIDTQKHEYGHQIQSFILGPLYLFVIGIPSLLWANVFWKPEKRKYSWFYTEKWADKLGKVKQ